MIKKEYKNDFGDDLIFEFPDELLPKYERWVKLNTTEGSYDEWNDIDEELLPYKTDLQL